MREDLVQYIWNTKLLCTQKQRTTSGKTLEILDPGQWNTDQGPDFLFSKIRIDGTVWVGHVEIHLRASDWNRHTHAKDPHYQNTVLHVVMESDVDIFHEGRRIECFEIRSLLPQGLVDRYEGLMNSSQHLPCASLIGDVEPHIKSMQFERMMVERLEKKTLQLKTEWEALDGDWDALCIKKMAHYMVAPVNGPAMDKLMEYVPVRLLYKIHFDLLQLEAVMFGCAGFLQGNRTEAYYQMLQEQFQYLKYKYQLKSMHPVEWKFLRLRPAHFPTLRIAQLCALLHKHQRWFSSLMECQKPKDFHQFFRVECAAFWKTHYHFGQGSGHGHVPTIGSHLQDILLINAVIPLMFSFGRLQSQTVYEDRALELLELLKPESNIISRMWKNYNFALNHAGHSQAGIQLYREYCLKKRCTRCMIGHKLLRS